MAYVPGCSCGGCSKQTTENQVAELAARVKRLEELLESTEELSEQRRLKLEEMVKAVSFYTCADIKPTTEYERGYDTGYDEGYSDGLDDGLPE